MASARVEHLLDEITRLSPEEQAELMRDLPRVLQHGSNGGHRGQQGGLSAEAVQQAIQTREWIRRRLATAQQSPGSINEDLEESRNDRLEELLDGGLGAMKDQVR